MPRLCTIAGILCAGYAAILLLGCLQSETPVQQEMYMVVGIFAFAAFGLFRLAIHLRIKDIKKRQ